MEVSSYRQVCVFLIFVVSGLLCGIFFDFQRVLREKHRAGKIRTLLEDILFVLFCIVTVTGFAYVFNNGELRYFQFMGNISGILFYVSMLSDAFKKLLNTVFSVFVNLVIKPIRKIYSIISTPFKAIIEKVKRLKNAEKKMMRKLDRHMKKRRKYLKKRIKML